MTGSRHQVLEIPEESTRKAGDRQVKSGEGEKEGGGGGGGGGGGLVLAVGAALSTSVCSVLVKKEAGLPAGELSWLCSLGLLAVSLPVALYRGEELFPRGHRAALLGASLASLPLLLTSYQALRLMPLGDEAVLSYSSVGFTLLLGGLLLGEPCSPRDLLACLGVLLGVVLLTQPSLLSSSPSSNSDSPSYYPRYPLGAGLSLLGSVSDSVAYVLVRRVSSLPCSVILVDYCLASLAVTSLFPLFETWTLPFSPTPGVVVLVALTGLQELLVTRALLVENAGKVALVQASDVVFAYLWELLLFSESYSPMRVGGALLVTATVLLTALSSERT